MSYKVYQKLDQKSREYLRDITLGGSTFFKKTDTALSLNRFMDNHFKTEAQELYLEGNEPIENKPVEEMNALEKGVYYEPKAIMYFAKKYNIDNVVHCEKTFVGDNGFTSANIDGFIGKSIVDAKTIIEVKTSSTILKSIGQVYLENEWQLQYYLWFFEKVENILLLYYNIENKTLSHMLVWRDKIIQNQIIARIDKIEKLKKERENVIPKT